MKSHLKHEWFETFFQGPAVEFWTNAMTPALTLADVDFLEKTFDVKPGARLLDVPCGNGRHSIELARRGYRVTGIDLVGGISGGRAGRTRRRLAIRRHAGAGTGIIRIRWRVLLRQQLRLPGSRTESAAFLSSMAGALKPGREAGDRNRRGCGIDSADDGPKALAPLRRSYSS